MANLPEIPGYKIEKKLGEGGMATVYLGIQDKLHRKVAVKILSPAVLKKKVVELRFLQEAETAANLYHSNIVSIFDVGRVGDYNYIVMEYLEKTLKDYLSGFPGFRLKPDEAIDILKPILEALDYAHARGIIHRDIKTDNIMFREDGVPVLMDFGIARALDSDMRMTRTGMSVGIPYYMSPEQCRAEELDGRSDIYSLGVVFFEILTGKKPYVGDSPTAVALKHIQEPLPQLPGELKPYQPLIDKMLAKRKEDRVSNGKELIKLMDSVLEQARPASIPAAAVPAAGPVSKTLPPSAPAFEPVPLPSTPPGAVHEPVPKPVSVSESAPTITEKLFFLSGKSPVKKIAAAAVMVLLLVVIFIIFYNLGAGGKKQASKLPEQSPQYRENHKPALDQQLREVDFNTYFSNAESYLKQKNFKKARENILLAKEIKSTPRVKALEKRINEADTKSQGRLKQKKKQKKAPPTADDRAYKLARAKNTTAAYREYMEKYPSGRHVGEVIAKLNKLEEVGRLRREAAKRSAVPKVYLRSGYKTLGLADVDAMVRENNFFENEFNQRGSFKNKYKEQFIKDDAVVTDAAANLMWYAGKSAKPMTFKSAEKWTRRINARKYAGYKDWRLPTIEEAASLLRKRKNAAGLHIDSVFTDRLKSIWTGDLQRIRTYWVVRFYLGTVFADSERSTHHVLLVRSIK